MIFTHEAPLTGEWFSGRSRIRSNWNLEMLILGRRENWRTRTKTSWRRIKNRQPTEPTYEIKGYVINVGRVALVLE